MKNRKIILLVIVVLALFSFHNAQKKFYILVKTKIQSYQMGENYSRLTGLKPKKQHGAYPVADKNDKNVQLIYFRLE